MPTIDEVVNLIYAHCTGNDADFRKHAGNMAANAKSNGKYRMATRIDRALQRTPPRSLSPLEPTQASKPHILSYVWPKHEIEDMILDPDQRRELDGIFEEKEKTEDLLRGGFEPCTKLMFEGPSGVGKTMMAGAIANKLDLPLAIVRIDGCMDSYLGGTGKNLTYVFQQMKVRPAVYMFDEADSIMRARGNASSVSFEMERVLNGVLQRMDEENSGNIMIAATNLGGAIDKAMIRRFDRVISFRRPDGDMIRNIIKRRVGHLKHDDVEWDRVIMALGDSCSHADAAAAANVAGKMAILGGMKHVTTEDLVHGANERSDRKNIESRLQ